MKRKTASSFFVLAALLGAHGVAHGQRVPLPVCNLVLHEEQVALEDARLEVDVARSSVAAFEEIFGLIEALWERQATERMVYLRAKYDRDAALLGLEYADRILERQAALVEQYRLVCDAIAAGKPYDRQALGQAHGRYLRADCEAQVKAQAIAETNLAFDREWLASILDLRASEVGTRQDVILAELEVEKEEKRLEDARRRVTACRRQLARPAASPDESAPPR